MMNSSILWGLLAGAVFLLGLWMYRFLLPRILGEFRKLSSDANSLLAPKAQAPRLTTGANSLFASEGQESRSFKGANPLQAPESQEPAATSSVSPGPVIPTVRALATAVLVVAWPVFTFILPFTAFYPPFLFVYVAYPLVWYFSGVFYKAALAEGKQNLLMASAPLLFLLAIGVVLLLIAALVAAVQR